MCFLSIHLRRMSRIFHLCFLLLTLCLCTCSAGSVIITKLDGHGKGGGALSA